MEGFSTAWTGGDAAARPPVPFQGPVSPLRHRGFGGGLPVWYDPNQPHREREGTAATIRMLPARSRAVEPQPLPVPFPVAHPRGLVLVARDRLGKTTELPPSSIRSTREAKHIIIIVYPVETSTPHKG